mgnify:CR=1 FL=1
MSFTETKKCHVSCNSHLNLENMSANTEKVYQTLLKNK